MRTQPATLYDDSYHGVRYRYGLQHRGISQYMGCRDLETNQIIPWIIFSDRTSEDPRLRFGTFDSAAELSERTVEQLQLVALGQVDTSVHEGWCPVPLNPELRCACTFEGGAASDAGGAGADVSPSRARRPGEAISI